MIQIEHPIPFSPSYDLTKIGPLEQLLFFDIETTGFSADTASLYLIGCVYFQEGQWHLCQWFADSRQAEAQVLEAFFQRVQEFSILVHFNGDTFDLPFLQKRSQRLHLPCSFGGAASVDIYRKIRPLKQLLGLSSLKQKAVEDFLGVCRKDTFSGGELIPMYGEYLKTGDERLLHFLLLHNEDDLKGMPAILPILSYVDWLEGPFSLTSCQLEEGSAVPGQKGPLLNLSYSGPVSLPASFSAQAEHVSCFAQGSLLKLQVELYEGELKYFYPNYQDYYYLPWEDTAVHRSVGACVDPEARRKATAKTCYTRSQGVFLPQAAPLWSPALKRDYKDPLTFVPYDAALFEDQKSASAYALLALEYLQNHKGKGKR